MKPGKRIKVVIDTNTWISAMLGKDSNPARVVKKIKDETVVNYTSEEIMEEIKEVMQRSRIKRITKEHERHFLRYFIGTMSVFTEPKERLHVINDDPDDNRILECAITGNVNYIISGDKHLLNLKEYKGIRIVNSKRFLEIVD